MRLLETNDDSDTIPFALWLCVAGIGTAEDIYFALQFRACHRPRIGHIAVQKSLLTVEQSSHVLELQASSDQRYGELAVQRGWLREDDLSMLVELQQKMTPALIDILATECGYDRTSLRADYEAFAIDHAIHEGQRLAAETEPAMGIFPAGNLVSSYSTCADL